MMKAGMSLLGAAVLATGIAASSAQAAEMSEEAVRWWMEKAWQNTPSRFTTPAGEVILIDKKKEKEQVLIPILEAREVLAVGQRSYRAQICELPDEQAANFRSMSARFEQKKKTKQQEVYITMLHLTVVQMMAGKLERVEKEDGKVVAREPVESRVVKPCTDEERVRLKEEIASYVKSGPAMASAAPPATAPAAAPAPAAAKPAAAPSPKK